MRELHGLATGLNRTHLLLSSSESDLKQPFSPRKMVTQRSVVLAASQMPAWFPFRAQGVCRSPLPGSTLLHLSPAGMRGGASTPEKAQAVQGGVTESCLRLSSTCVLWRLLHCLASATTPGVDWPRSPGFLNHQQGWDSPSPPGPGLC